MEDANLTPNVPEQEHDNREMQNVNTPLAEAATPSEPIAPESIAPEPVAEPEAPAPEPSAAEEPAAPETAPQAERPEAAPIPENKEPEYQEEEVDYTGLSREELTEKLKELLQEDVMHIRNRVSQLKDLFGALNKEVQKADYEAFLADGGESNTYVQHNDEVADNFFKLYDQYRALRKKQQDEQEAEKQANLEKKQEVVNLLRTLVESQEQTTIKNLYDRFNELQEQWKAIGEVPRTEINNLWQSYHLWVDRFFTRVKLEKDSKLEDMKRNLEQKLQLCESAEEELVNTNEGQAFRKLQELREQWKTIGPVPPEQNEEIWARFRAAADKISTRHREALASRREELEKNLLAKQALLQQAEELTATLPTTAKGWTDITTHLDELLSVWKTIGPVPKENNEELWQAFKQKLDSAYSEKKTFFEKMRSEQSENYNKKLDLCQKAEAIAERDDFAEATKELLALQAEWKTIGTVRRPQSEKLWARFRAACDKFFDKKNQHYQETHGNEQENLEKKEALLSELRNIDPEADREANMNLLKDIQRRWLEVGYVPRKEKDRIQQEFRTTLNTLFDKLKTSAREAEELAFKERVQHHAGDLNFNRSNAKALTDKIERLRSDIKTFENNLGFISTSKQSSLLKEEFDRKLANSRQQLALLEAKLKILRTAASAPAPTVDAAEKDAPEAQPTPQPKPESITPEGADKPTEDTPSATE